VAGPGGSPRGPADGAGTGLVRFGLLLVGVGTACALTVIFLGAALLAWAAGVVLLLAGAARRRGARRAAPAAAISGEAAAPAES
jgi:hypothetical protein